MDAFRATSLCLSASVTLVAVHVRGVGSPNAQLCRVTRYALCCRHTSVRKLIQA